MDALLAQFLEEAKENLAYLDENLDSLENAQDDDINALFRAAHTLKGGAGLVGCEDIKELTHHAENLLDKLRNGSLDYADGMVDALYGIFDYVFELADASEAKGDVAEANPAKIEEILNAMDEFIEVKKDDTFQIPFNISQDPSVLTKTNLIETFAKKNIVLPLNDCEIDEEFCEREQYYLAIFDLDQECMVYGNDPLYALSIFEDSLVSIETCISENDVNTIFDSYSNVELMHTQLAAVIKSDAELIDDALFNFIDEVEFLPLSVELLISKVLIPHLSDENHNDLNVAFAKSTVKRSEIDFVAKGFDGISRDTLEYILDNYDFNDVITLISKLDDKIETKVNENAQENDGVSEAELKTIKMMITQQLRQLVAMPNIMTLKRVGFILNKFASTIDLDLELLEDESNIPRLVEVLEAFTNGDKPSEIVKPKESKPLIKKAEKKPEPKIEAKTIVDIEETVKVDNEVKEKELDKKSEHKATIKIDQDLIDHLLNISGELLVAKNSLTYLAEQSTTMDKEETRRAINEKYLLIDRVAMNLQDVIMNMRMLPLSFVFDRYPRLVRDISKKLNKKVKFSYDGGETTLDKNIIEMMADPLIHIMRNSLDHGIEFPEERKSKGKSDTGSVKIKAYSESDKVILEISDDGAGIDVEKVVNKVLEKNLLSLEELETMDEQEQLQLILLAGLTTADTLTEFSGRGVGMDVVKTSIEKFGGEVRLTSKKDEGTTVTLAVPVSMAVTNLMHVKTGAINCGLPMDYLKETVKIGKKDIKHLHNKQVISIRGDIIPLFVADEMLDIENIDYEALTVLIVEARGLQVGFVVNSIEGQLDVVQKPLEGMMANHPIFSGTSILGDGSIMMVLDPMGLINWASQSY
jgi:two-component system chemotaxis sensor kinase CheA